MSMANRSRKKCSGSGALETSLAELPIRRLANSLGFTDRWLTPFLIRFPDGSLFITARARWCVLIKAVVEQFCARFASNGVVLCIGDTENKFLHLDTGYLEKLN